MGSVSVSVEVWTAKGVWGCGLQRRKVTKWQMAAPRSAPTGALHHCSKKTQGSACSQGSASWSNACFVWGLVPLAAKLSLEDGSNVPRRSQLPRCAAMHAPSPPCSPNTPCTNCSATAATVPPPLQLHRHCTGCTAPPPTC
eukprot:366462-Chlamydomonas_euryale.AAC.35